ncbi:ArgE/DapE family deacylase [Flexivirga oryzae]|uniref:Probable succinyl-diaminopimelate desuccinylase n=1 Tax=Flexivirga oryzae TaxID=1794944 RepID=A0A839N5N9_9MICO|nr:acetylornithine deacetylase [Flexivirga oryzae]
MNGLTADEQRVLDLVDDEAILADLAALVAIPSAGGSSGEVAAQRWCAQRLRVLGFDVDEWDIDVPALTAAVGFPGAEVERAAALGVVGVLPASDGSNDADRPALAFGGHTDVVPPGNIDAWTSDPFVLRIQDGVGYGRGVCDMKAGVAAMIGAVDALRRAGVHRSRSIAVHCVSGEEDGGLGAFATLQRGHRADACVITEPTAAAVIPTNAGSLTFRIEVPGLATHGSQRWQGVSAIDKLDVLQTALRRLEAERNAGVPAEFAHLQLPWPLSIGIVHAGDWASTVPDLLIAEGRYGVRPGERVEDAQRAFEQAVCAESQRDPWLREHPVRISWPGGRFAAGSLPQGHPLLQEVRDAVSTVRGSVPDVVGAPYGSDLRLYAGAGVPTLQYGPGRVEQAHAVDESVELADVLACARVCALLAVRASSTEVTGE